MIRDRSCWSTAAPRKPLRSATPSDSQARGTPNIRSVARSSARLAHGPGDEAYPTMVLRASDKAGAVSAYPLGNDEQEAHGRFLTRRCIPRIRRAHPSFPERGTGPSHHPTGSLITQMEITRVIIARKRTIPRSTTTLGKIYAHCKLCRHCPETELSHS